MKELLTLTTDKLKRVLALRTQIEKLQAQLEKLAGGTATAVAKPAAKGAPKKRTMSAAGRRRISLAQKARWAKQKAGKGN